MAGGVGATRVTVPYVRYVARIDVDFARRQSLPRNTQHSTAPAQLYLALGGMQSLEGPSSTIADSESACITLRKSEVFRASPHRRRLRRFSLSVAESPRLTYRAAFLLSLILNSQHVSARNTIHQEVGGLGPDEDVLQQGGNRDREQVHETRCCSEDHVEQARQPGNQVLVQQKCGDENQAPVEQRRCRCVSSQRRSRCRSSRRCSGFDNSSIVPGEPQVDEGCAEGSAP